MGETGLLMDIKRFAVHDGPGIRTTLFMKGCPLHCLWCHNPEGISSQPEIAFYPRKCISCDECVHICPKGAHRMNKDHHAFVRDNCIPCGLCEKACLGEALCLYGKSVTVENAVEIALQDLPFYISSHGGVTFSGGEPMMQSDFVRSCCKELKKRNIHTAVDTCGSVSWSKFAEILDVVDLFLYDLKHMDGKKHKQLTGQDNDQILSNLKYLSKYGAEIEIRMPLIPGINMGEEEMHQAGAFLQTLHIKGVRLLKYHSLARSKYIALGKQDTMPNVSSPTDEEVQQCATILQKYGIPIEG